MPTLIDLPVDGTITQLFGGMHGGLDIAGAHGTPVYAPCDGWLRLYPQGSQGDGSFGNAAHIVLDDGWYMVLAHMQQFESGIFDGPVRAGQRLGYQGFTGYTVPTGIAGSHVHLGLCRDATFPPYRPETAHLFGNPLDYLITEAERMLIFTRLEAVEYMLGGADNVDRWRAMGNIPLVAGPGAPACLGETPSRLREVFAPNPLGGGAPTWDGILAQTYGTNEVLMAWRPMLQAALPGLVLP